MENIIFVVKVYNNSKKEIRISLSERIAVLLLVRLMEILYRIFDIMLLSDTRFCDKKEKHTGNDSLYFSSLNLEFHVPSNSLSTKNTKDEYFNVLVFYSAWQNLTTKWQMYTFHLTLNPLLWLLSHPLEKLSDTSRIQMFLATRIPRKYNDSHKYAYPNRPDIRKGSGEETKSTFLLNLLNLFYQESSLSPIYKILIEQYKVQTVNFFRKFLILTPKCMISIQFFKLHIIRDGSEIYLILLFKKWYQFLML